MIGLAARPGIEGRTHMIDAKCTVSERFEHVLLFALVLCRPGRVVRHQLDQPREPFRLTDGRRSNALFARAFGSHQNLKLSAQTCSSDSSPVTVRPSVPRLFIDQR